MFKFKKYKKGYENGKRGIGSFLKGEGQDAPKSGATHAVKVGASLNAPSSDATPLTSGLLPTALNAG